MLSGTEYATTNCSCAIRQKIWISWGDTLAQEGINTACDHKLLAIKGYKAQVKLIPGSQLMLCKARKTPLPLQDSVKEIFETVVQQEYWSQGYQGVPNAFPVVWQREKMELLDYAWT